MAFFNSSSPAYKKAASPNATAYAPSAPSNGLASMFGSLLGGTSPSYKTRDGHAAREPSSSGLLRIFIGTPPSYKTAQPMTAELVDEEFGEAVDAVQAEDEDADDACPPPIDTVVLL